MLYTDTHKTFDLAAFAKSLLEKLPKEEQTSELQGRIEDHITSIIIQTIQKMVSYEDADLLINQIDQQEEKANAILVDYIESKPELMDILEDELDHFEVLITKNVGN